MNNLLIKTPTSWGVATQQPTGEYHVKDPEGGYFICQSKTEAVEWITAWGYGYDHIDAPTQPKHLTILTLRFGVEVP